MSDVLKPRVIDFRRGMETTREEQNDDLFSWRELLNARVDKASLRRRKGMESLYKATTTVTALAFDAVDDAIAIAHDSRVWALSALPEWTLEGLFKPTSYAAARTIFSRNTGTAANVDVLVYMDSTSSGRIVCELMDSAAAKTTIAVTGIAATTVVAWRLTKATTGTYTLYANGSSSTGTLGSGTLKVNTTDALAVGKQNSGLLFLGSGEFVRLFRGVRQTFADAYCRLLDPRAPSVLADYCLDIDANNYCVDRSAFGNHATVAGSPATTTTLAVNHAPIRGLAHNKDKQGRRRVYFWAGNVLYPATF